MTEAFLKNLIIYLVIVGTLFFFLFMGRSIGGEETDNDVFWLRIEQIRQERKIKELEQKLEARTKTEQIEFEQGIASWYDYELGGVVWSRNHATCASRDYPRYTTIHVVNLASGKSVDCYVNDYGPEEWTGRIIDLSSYAFAQIADLRLGLVEVVIN